MSGEHRDKDATIVGRMRPSDRLSPRENAIIDLILGVFFGFIFGALLALILGWCHIAQGDPTNQYPFWLNLGLIFATVWAASGVNKALRAVKKALREEP